MFRHFAKLFSRRRTPARAYGARLELEHLEDRVVPNAAWGLNGPPLTADTGGATKVTLSNGDASGSASILKKNEVDFFKFTTSAAGFYTFRATASFDAVVGLYDASAPGKLLGYADRIRANTTQATESFSVYLNGNKTYFLGVTNYGATVSGNYTWAIDDVDPAPGNPTVPDAKRYLYAQFDGAFISPSDLQTWDDDWNYDSLAEFDVNYDGVTIQPFLSSNPLYANRETIIAGVLSNLQTDLAPFGVRVVRLAPGASAVTGVGATTLFFGVSDLDNGYQHVAADIDVGNDNKTDIAFIYDEYWGGDVGKEVLAASDVALHEAGHTYGLEHVNSGTNLETMGIRYSVTDHSFWPNNTAFMNQSFGYLDPTQHGSQNAYQEVARAFGIGNPLPPTPPANPSLADYFAEERVYSQAHNSSSTALAAVPASTPQVLQATGSPQGKINVSSNGSIDLRLAINAGQLDGKGAVASLFDGVNFTIWVQGTASLMYTSTAKVAGNGDITLSLPMDDALKADLGYGFFGDQTVDFLVSAIASDGNYALNVDITALVHNNVTKVRVKN